MAKTVINVKVDRDIKKKAQSLAEELGLPLSTVINANLREFIRSGEAIFSIEPKIKTSVWKELKAAAADYEAGKNVSRTFGSAQEALDYLAS